MPARPRSILATPPKKETANPKRFASRPKLGAALREMREAADLSQQQLADLFGWQRSAVNKLETGVNDIYLYDFLEILYQVREAVPDHPGLPLVYALLGYRQVKRRA